MTVRIMVAEDQTMVRQALVALLELEPGGRLLRDGFDGKVIIVTTFDRPGYLRAAMTAGASGFLLQDAPAADLAAAIRRVAAGERVVDSSLAAAALAQGDSPLTGRERQALGTTVRNHLSAAIQKLGARNRAEAVQIAQRKGWL